MMKKPSILIVDDEPDLRDAIAFDFQRADFRVLTAASGEEAFRILEENEIDVVLSDIGMANGGGIELLEKIKARNPFQPVVMLITGFADITLEEAFKKGADAVFSKPFDRKMLMQAVVGALQPSDQNLMRRCSRVAIEAPIELKVNGRSHRAKLVNIGRGGIFAELGDVVPAVSDNVDFVFEAASWGPKLRMAGRGVVRWVRTEAKPLQPAGCGIEFTELSADSSRNVIELINFTKTRSYLPLR
jgi:CheY-like chemotaxis protein/Tfp pilus assembly protein PilZ